MAGGTGGVFRSTDDGRTWTPTGPVDGLDCDYCSVFTLVADPSPGGAIYAGGSMGIAKSTDGGATWTPSNNGLAPDGSSQNRNFVRIDYIAIDPFHPQVLFTGNGLGAFRSLDGAASWEAYFPPTSPFGRVSGPTPKIAFDPFHPDVVLMAGAGGLFRNINSVFTWERLTPDVGSSTVVLADPTRPGVFYSNGNGDILRTSDGGDTWQPLPIPEALANGDMYIDPRDGALWLGSSRSTDGGITWSRTALGRSPDELAFDLQSPGRMWAAAPTTRDGFIARLDPSGEHILFATYFGGGGDDTIDEMKLDPQGNIHVMGRAGQSFPLTANPAFPDPVESGTAFFVAKLSPKGEAIFATHPPNVPLAMAPTPSGGMVLTGFYCELVKFAPDGGLVFFHQDEEFRGRCLAATVDRDETIVIAGHASTFGEDYHITPDALQPTIRGSNDGFLVRYDPAGNVIYGTFLGGPPAADAPTNITSNGSTSIMKLAFDARGELVVSGNTSAAFPTTEGAFQREFQPGCEYPSRADSSFGIGPNFPSWNMDDVFVTRLDRSLTSIVSSTLLGGDCYEYPTGLALDPDGNAWVTGVTNSNPFPQLSSFQAGPETRHYSGFVAKIGREGQLLSSSYIPADSAPSVASDRAGTAWIGDSNAPGYPGQSGGLGPPPIPPPTDGYLARVGQAAGTPLKITSAGSLATRRNGPISPGDVTLVLVDGLRIDNPQHLGWGQSDPLPRELSGVQVFFDGEPAAIYAVGNGYIECLAPYSLDLKANTIVQVYQDGQASQALRVDVVPFNLGLLSADGSGSGQANARNQDGSLNTPANPATPGSLVTFFFTGAGLVNPSCSYGATATAAPLLEAAIGITTRTAEGSNVRENIPVAPLPWFLCGFYYTQFRIPEDWQPQSDVEVSIHKRRENGSVPSQTLTFSVGPETGD